MQISSKDTELRLLRAERDRLRRENAGLRSESEENGGKLAALRSENKVRCRSAHQLV